MKMFRQMVVEGCSQRCFKSEVVKKLKYSNAAFPQPQDYVWLASGLEN